MKVGRAAPVKIGHMDQIDTFVTDWLPSQRLRTVCAESGVEAIEARPEMRGEPD